MGLSHRQTVLAIYGICLILAVLSLLLSGSRDEVATAGRSVVFASATVLVSLLGLRLSGLPVYSSFGFATAITVVAVALAALTLVPALCGLAGDRLLPRSVRRGRIRTGAPLMARWATRVGKEELLVGSLLRSRSFSCRASWWWSAWPWRQGRRGSASSSWTRFTRRLRARRAIS